jgi:hypothetical protein
MDLYAHINGVDYQLAVDVPLTDNLGEELDSMTINIPHVPGLDIKPYDDVIIHDYRPNYNKDGTFLYSNLPYRNYSEAFDDRFVMVAKKRLKGNTRHFYRHFLISDWRDEQVNNVVGMYNYSIDLISETKILEKYPLPNRTITNPLNRPGKTVAWMANHFCNRYSWRIKVTTFHSENKWEYVPRIVVSGFEKDAKIRKGNEEVAELLGVETIGKRFGNIRCFETSFNNPNLREVLTKIFQASNCLPYIRDGVLFCIDLKKKRDRFESIPGEIWKSGSMTGSDYVDRLRKNYSGALTGPRGTKFHEFVGFRNINSATMKITNLKIETKYPIYLIDKFILCFYSAEENGELVKYDLTSFVLPSTTRALLSNDYLYFNKHQPKTLNGYKDYHGNYVLGLCDYRFMTVEYKIGSKEITGFGDFIQYTENGITYNKKCVLENVLNVALEHKYNSKAFEASLKPNENPNVSNYVKLDVGKREFYKDIVAPEPSSEWLSSVVAKASAYLFGDIDSNNKDGGYVGNNTLAMKNIFFEIEYQAQISSAVIVAKDRHDGEIMAPDSQQESLAITEQDGIVSEVKANRLGNKTRVVTARVPYGFGTRQWDAYLIRIGQWNEEYGICYKRTITIGVGFISIVYFFCKDYVLANFYTSVFAKYRSSAYASIGESVSREENRYFSLLLSNDTALRCDTNQTNGGDNSQREWKDWQGFDGKEYVYGYDFKLPFDSVIGLFKPSKENEKPLAMYSLNAPKQDIYFFDEATSAQAEYQYFVSDRAQYLSGDSLCISFGMSDSVTSGTYIRQMYPNLSNVTLDALGISKGENESSISSYGQYITYDSPISDVTGTMQNFLSLPLSKSDGSVSGIKFSFCGNKDNVQGKAYGEENLSNTKLSIDSFYYEHLYKLPRISSTIATSSGLEECHVSVYEDYKDSKEIISETFQVDPVSDDEGTAISPYFMKMSPMAGDMVEKNFARILPEDDTYPLLLFADSHFSATSAEGYALHSFGMYSQKGDLSLTRFKELVGKEINKKITTQFYGTGNYVGTTLEITIHKIVRIDEYARYLVVDMSFHSNVALPSSATEPWKNLESVDASHVNVVWWNAAMIDTDKEEMKPLINQERQIDGVTGYYPSFLHAESGDVGFAYDYAYHWHGTNKPTYFTTIENRVGFVFNMASFPNYQSKIKYKDGVPTVAGSTYWNPTEIDPTGNAELAQPVLNSRCGVWYGGSTLIPSTWNYEATQSKLADISAESAAKEQTVFWFLSKDSIDSSFDTNISYSREEVEGLETAGGIKVLPCYTDFKESDLGKECVHGYIKEDDTLESKPTAMYLDIYETITVESPEWKSAKCFIVDRDGLYHFVFGTNIANPQLVPGTTVKLYRRKLYLSIVPDRSRTVYGYNDMEPRYRTANYANADDIDTVTPSSTQGCVQRDGFGNVGKI